MKLQYHIAASYWYLPGYRQNSRYEKSRCNETAVDWITTVLDFILIRYIFLSVVVIKVKCYRRHIYETIL